MSESRARSMGTKLRNQGHGFPNTAPKIRGCFLFDLFDPLFLCLQSREKMFSFLLWHYFQSTSTKLFDPVARD